MAVIQSNLFWEMHLENSGLKPFRDTLDQLNLTDLARQIKQLRNRSGRQDWPVEGMLRSLYAMSILQHRSTESFRRELQRNPHLMLALGFQLKPSEGSEKEDRIDPAECHRPQLSVAFASSCASWNPKPVSSKPSFFASARS